MCKGGILPSHSYQMENARQFIIYYQNELTWKFSTGNSCQDGSLQNEPNTVEGYIEKNT